MKHGKVECIDCGCQFDINEYDNIDDEFNKKAPKCPSCQEQSRIESEKCEYCDKPASQEIGDMYFCDEHLEDYLEHYPDLNETD